MNHTSRADGVTLGSVRGRELRVGAPHIEASYQHARQIAAELGTGDAESSLAAYWSLGSRLAQWQQIFDRVGAARAPELQFVEVGSGLGLFTLAGAALGMHVVGVESSSDRYLASIRIAQRLLADNGFAPVFVQSRSEQLALPDACADVVASFQTLEHVSDLRQTLAEMRRVLRPGGWLFAQAPNYTSLYEGHYGLLAPLGLGKSWTRRYMRLVGRPAGFLDHLQWLSPAYLRNQLREAGFTAISVGRTRAPGLSAALGASPAPAQFRFRRGALANRAAYAIALGCDKLGICADLYPQLQAWARA